MGASWQYPASLSRKDIVNINSYASQCLRDVADGDYIAARLLYRHGFAHQFCWSAAQAIEKYLKCILLFNLIRHPSPTHNLKKLLKRCNKIPFVITNISDEERHTINVFNKKGVPDVRYGQINLDVTPIDLENLDKLVWSLRRFCKQFRLPGEQFPVDICKSHFDACVSAIANGERYLPTATETEGLLGKICNGNTLEVYLEILVWNNSCFASNVNVQARDSIYFLSSEAFLSRHPDAAEILEKYVFLGNDKHKAVESWPRLKRYLRNIFKLTL